MHHKSDFSFNNNCVFISYILFLCHSLNSKLVTAICTLLLFSTGAVILPNKPKLGHQAHSQKNQQLLLDKLLNVVIYPHKKSTPNIF